jgi:serine/threonine protein kinase
LFPIKGVELGFATDIWALGATLSDVRHGIMPFFLRSHCQHDYCKRIEEVLGPLPAPYRSLMRNHDGVQHEGTQYNPIDQPISMTPEEWLKKQDLRLRRFGHTDPHEAQIMEPDAVQEAPPPDALHLLDLLRKIFKYNPHDRFTIAQVKAHPWFRDYFPEAKEANIQEDIATLDGQGHYSRKSRDRGYFRRER